MEKIDLLSRMVIQYLVLVCNSVLILILCGGTKILMSHGLLPIIIRCGWFTVSIFIMVEVIYVILIRGDMMKPATYSIVSFVDSIFAYVVWQSLVSHALKRDVIIRR